MKKRLSKFVYGLILSICMVASSLNVMAAPTDHETEDCRASQIAGRLDMEDCKEYELREVPNVSEVEQIVEFLQLGNKEFVQQSSILNIEDILADADICTLSSDVSGAFTSATFETGTPGVKWYYEVDYIISPMPSGIGWYFNSVDIMCYYKKEWSLWTWANTCTITWESATYTPLPEEAPTSLTVNITLNFSVTTSATGIQPITYSESHSHTTQIENVYS